MKSICLRVGIGNQNWMDHSHHSGKVRNWWEHWQVYVTDVEFNRDGTILVYIEKCRDWFSTYSLCSSGLYNCCHSCRLHIFSSKRALEQGWRKLLEKRIHLRGQGNCMFGWRTWSRPGKTAGGKFRNFNAETLMTGWERPGRMQWPSLDNTWWGDNTDNAIWWYVYIRYIGITETCNWGDPRDSLSEFSHCEYTHMEIAVLHDVKVLNTKWHFYTTLTLDGIEPYRSLHESMEREVVESAICCHDERFPDALVLRDPGTANAIVVNQVGERVSGALLPWILKNTSWIDVPCPMPSGCHDKFVLCFGSQHGIYKFVVSCACEYWNRLVQRILTT